ncbi:uncharacterized protein METZ01_LOCUS245841, partial [marine metagenome]
KPLMKLTLVRSWDLQLVAMLLLMLWRRL